MRQGCKLRASSEHSGLPCCLLCSSTDLAHPSAANPAHKVSCQEPHPLCLPLQETKSAFSSLGQDTAVHRPDLKTDAVLSGNLLQQLPTEQSDRKWFAFSLFHWVRQGRASCPCLFIADNLRGHKCYTGEGNAKLFAKRQQARAQK